MNVVYMYIAAFFPTTQAEPEEIGSQRWKERERVLIILFTPQDSAMP